MNKIEIGSEHLLGIRCICIIGIIFAHSYIPAVYETGYLWRIPILFLVGGAALIKARPLKSTLNYVFKDFYLFIIIWSLIYLVALFIIFSGQSPNKFTPSFEFVPIFITDIFVHNNHRNTIILGSWFLIPYAISLLILNIGMNFIPRFTYLQIPAGFLFLIVSFSLIYPHHISWPQRIVAQTFLASGLMLLGRSIFTSSFILKSIKNGWVILLTFGLSVWISKSFDKPELTWSWMTYKGQHWLILPAIILFIPIIFWIGKQISSFKFAIYIGKNSKHIMMHHLFGFLILNLLLIRLGYVSKDEIHPFFIFNGNLFWPLYLIFALAWSLLIVESTNRVRTVLRKAFSRVTTALEMGRA